MAFTFERAASTMPHDVLKGPTGVYALKEAEGLRRFNEALIEYERSNCIAIPGEPAALRALREDFVKRLLADYLQYSSNVLRVLSDLPD